MRLLITIESAVDDYKSVSHIDMAFSNLIAMTSVLSLSFNRLMTE